MRFALIHPSAPTPDHRRGAGFASPSPHAHLEKLSFKVRAFRGGKICEKRSIKDNLDPLTCATSSISFDHALDPTRIGFVGRIYNGVLLVIRRPVA